MRLPTWAALAATILGCTAPEASDPTPDPETERVVAAAELILAAITAEDTAMLRRAAVGSATFYAIGDDDVSMSSVDQMSERFVTGPDLFERMWDPEVWIDGPMAAVRAPYDFYVDGAFSHCGVDLFQLARIGGEWKVTSIAYTRERDNCPESPLGPPDLN